MRSWGKWVSEIRIPKSGERIWLGSYDTPEKAARAYDAAQYCIRGELGLFNFPADKRPVLPQGSMISLSKKDIHEIATSFASSESDISASCSSQISSAVSQVPSDNLASPDMLVSGVMDEAYEPVNISFAPTNVTGAAAASPECLELDDFLMLATDWMDELI